MSKLSMPVTPPTLKSEREICIGGCGDGDKVNLFLLNDSPDSNISCMMLHKTHKSLE
jgi:hypothetical protein